jgi:hypothetical protein
VGVTVDHLTSLLVIKVMSLAGLSVFIELC